MNRGRFHNGMFAPLLCLFAMQLIAAANPQAIAALQRQDYSGAERILRSDLRLHPDDAETLSLLGIALDQQKRPQEAEGFHKRAVAAAPGSTSALYNYANHLLAAGDPKGARETLQKAVAIDPSNLDLLYAFGIAASGAGDNERAVTALETVLRAKPNNVDAMYALAHTYISLSRNEDAVRVLAEAGKLAPRRAEIQKLLAVATRNISADEDSEAAWSRYLELVPGDDEARRERAFARARLELLDQAMPDLRAYAAKYPKDAVGLYELGMAESVDEPAAAIATLDRAIALNPDFVAARLGRGILLYSQNRPEAAVADLEFGTSRIPADAPDQARILDHLGQAYVAVDRLADAIKVFRRAVAMEPEDSTMLLHLANALGDAGQTRESEILTSKFREMRPGVRSKKVTGVVDYLAMTPEQRHEVYQARLEKAVKDRPDDVKARLLYLEFLLGDSRASDAAGVGRELAAMKPGAAALTEAGRAFLSARQYGPARDLLTQAAASDPSASLRIDVAVASFEDAGRTVSAAEQSLRSLDAVPEQERTADYFLARSTMLQALNRESDALVSLENAISRNPNNPILYWQAVSMLVERKKYTEALQMLDRATRVLPLDPQIPAIRALVLAVEGKPSEALELLAETERHWPESAAAWVANGSILSAKGDSAAARKALSTAATLGAHKGTLTDPSALLVSGPPVTW